MVKDWSSDDERADEPPHAVAQSTHHQQKHHDRVDHKRRTDAERHQRPNPENEGRRRHASFKNFCFLGKTKNFKVFKNF